MCVCVRQAAGGSEAHQQESVRAGQRDQGADGSEGDVRAVPRLQVDANAARLARRRGARRAHRRLLALFLQHE
eukprot:5815800-Pyramimonas_sp.AAC.1